MHNGIPYYLMVLNSNPECHFYSSVIPNDNDMTKLSFEPLISDLNLKIKCPDSDDFEGIGLVTSTDGITMRQGIILQSRISTPLLTARGG